jgi:ATP-dependent DNA helicase RecG
MSSEFNAELLEDGKLTAFESKTLEYRRDLSSKERIVKTLVAFANSSGGNLVIGVNDDHTIRGIDDPLVEENKLVNLVKDRIYPVLVPEIEFKEIDEKTVLVAKVYPAGRRPFYLREIGPEEGVFIRLGSSTLQADQWQIAELRRQSEGESFDRYPNHRAKNGLDNDLIAKTFPDHDVEHTSRVLELVADDQGRTVPTNGGVLLFGNDRDLLFQDSWVQCGRFAGEGRLPDLVDQVEYHAPLLELPDLVEGFLKRHAFKGADLTEWKRKDDWSVPIDILREAVINALIHSDYSQQGGPLRVAFYDDRVYVESLGGLLPGMTVETMRSGTSRIRNPIIARVFRELHVSEQWGYGVQRIFSRASELGLPEPEYVELPGRLRLIVHTFHAAIKRGERPRAGGTSSIETSAPTSLTKSPTPLTKSTGALPKSLTKSFVKLLSAANETPVSRSEILASINVTNQTFNAERYVQPLLDAGLLDTTRQNRAHNQKYQTTDTGRAWLAEHEQGHDLLA